MAKVVPFPQELRNSALHGSGRRGRQASSEVGEPATQLWRHDHETKAQRRADGLAEAADVKHSSSVIERSESRSRPAFQLQLAQVVVFDDPAIVSPGPGEQGEPSRQRHGHSKRCLLACCYSCKCCPLAVFMPTATSIPSRSTGTGVTVIPPSWSAVRVSGNPGSSIQASSPSSSSPCTARPSAPEKPAVTKT